MLPSEEAEGPMADLARSLDENFKGKAAKYEPTPYAFLNEENLKKATMWLAEFMGRFDDAVSPLKCPQADDRLLGYLVEVLLQNIPPSSPFPRLDGGDLGSPDPIDFRHLLYAGWIGWSQMTGTSPDDFLRLNRLCAHAILQQEGVRRWKKTDTANAG
jgi:hypothetical protein